MRRKPKVQVLETAQSPELKAKLHPAESEGQVQALPSTVERQSPELKCKLHPAESEGQDEAPRSRDKRQEASLEGKSNLHPA